MAVQDQKQIQKYFSTRAILYIPGLAIVFESVPAAILLCQLLFWHGKGTKKGGWIYKTGEEIKTEMGLTRSNQETAIRILEGYGVIETKLAGVPATKNFRIDLIALHELLPSLKKTYKLNYPNPPNSYVENGQSITKITNETTSKITDKPINRDNYRAAKQQLVNKKGLS
jgi:hypothetical protein